MASIGGIPIADVAPALRLLLLELAVLRPDVRGIVLFAPDRHGGDPVTWWELAEEFAARGPAVLVIAGAASADVLDGRARRAERTPATATRSRTTSSRTPRSTGAVWMRGPPSRRSDAARWTSR